MWTGTTALKNIDQTLQTIRNEAVRLDAQISMLTDTLAANQRHRLKIINDIAAVRLAEIQAGELQQNLTAADQQAAKILKQRDIALSVLNSQVEDLNQRISKIEIEREDLLQGVNHVSQKIVDCEAQVQDQLKQNEAYLTQLEKARAAESMSHEATQKAEQAQADLAEKAEPYQHDKLFMYLWEQQYGTTEYSGGLFARFMDSWVARLIEYEPARVNYWNLVEIPKRLSEHAQRIADKADAEHLVLQQIELDALAEAGVKLLENELNTLRDQIDQHDDLLENKENDLNQMLEERAKYMAGEDEYMHRCIARLTQALDHQDLHAIHRYVQATASATDDQLLIELQNLSVHLKTLSGDLGDVRSLHGNKINKLKELERVRRNFKNSRFDDVRSGFSNDSLLAGVLGQFLQGLVSGSDLWRTIKRNQGYRDVGSAPDFGSGGLGDLADIFGDIKIGRNRGSRGKRGSSWHLPKPRSGGGGFNLPRGGSRGGSSRGGGFKTGGGF